MLGVVIYITVKAIKGCEKLKKDYDRNHPDDDEDTVTPVTPPPKPISMDRNQPLQIAALAHDISDSGYTDPHGNVYCAVSDIYLDSDDGQRQAKIEIYYSFSTNVMNWNDTLHCYPQMMTSQPQGVRTKYFNKDGLLVGSQYQAFNTGTAQPGCVTISPTMVDHKNLRAESAA